MPAIRRLVRGVRRGRSAAAFSLIETVVAMMLFALVAASMMNVLSSATVADGLSRQKSIALELAQQQIEYVRQLNYSDVGTVSGNPPGSVLATQTKQVSGLSYTLTTRVKYVDDPVPTAIATHANYKQVRVIVSRTVDGKQLAQDQTYVSSATRAKSGGLNNGVINVTAKDFQTQELLGGAQVELTKTWDPAFSAGDTTNTDTGSPDFGQASFPGLEATPTSPSAGYYGVLVSLLHYEQLSDDLPPNDPANLQLAPSGTTNTTIRLYKPSTVTVRVIDAATGSLYTGSADVTLSSDWRGRDATITTTNGLATFTTIGDGSDAEKIVPGSDYAVTVEADVAGGYRQGAVENQTVPDDYSLTYPSSTIDVTLDTTVLPRSATITLEARYGSCPTGGSLQSGASVDINDSPDPHSPAVHITGTTDGSGHFTTTIPMGTYTLTASKRVSGRNRSGHADTNPYPTVVADGQTYCIPMS
jgi:type II secretory pathway pseudopilin PulG